MSFGLTIKNVCSSTTLSVKVRGRPILVRQNAMKGNTYAPLAYYLPCINTHLHKVVAGQKPPKLISMSWNFWNPMIFG